MNEKCVHTNILGNTCSKSIAKTLENCPKLTQRKNLNTKTTSIKKYWCFPY